jgi:hypothetical protein
VVIALKLSKAGYGRPDEVLEMRCDIVLAAAEYEGFLSQYEAEWIELNKDSK